MASRTFHFTTTASTSPVPVGNAGTDAMITGYEMSNVAATAMFVKFYWGNNTNFSSSNDVPTVGTDTPAWTVPLPSGSTTAPARVYMSWPQDSGPRGKGVLFMAVTGAQADSDTSNPAAGAVISVSYM